MDFDLSATHRAIRDAAREFARDQIAPHAAAWDREERFPDEVIPQLGELGFLGICIPEAYGGAGLDTLAYALITEEIARADGSLGLTVASHNGLASSHIAHFGDEQQKQRYLPKLASGEWLGAWALTEAETGSDASAVKTRAVKKGDHWVIDGNKMFITQGSVCGVCVVLALTDARRGHRGITAFAVERDTPGYQPSAKLGKMGMHASDTVGVTLENVTVADTQRIGAEGSGFVDAMSILDKGRVSIGALALGIGEAAFDSALRYSKERKQFGQPISDFQAIQWMLADSRTELDAARMLLWRAAWLSLQGQPFTKEAAMAKLYCSEAAQRVCDCAVQIHGGYGYVREFPVERYLRDVRMCRIGEGTSEIQRRVIARALLRDT